MKLIKKKFLIEEGDFLDSNEWAKLDNHIQKAISAVVWPPQNDEFIIRPEKNRNGVGPIKEAFFEVLQSKGWEKEVRPQIAVNKRPGPVDGMYRFENNGDFALEWETGNISSSHRAINKMCVGLLEQKLKGGALVLPSKPLYNYLTDRVGNYPELVPYFPVWESLKIDSGVLVIYVVEYDDTDESVESIKKGTDGRALV